MSFVTELENNLQNTELIQDNLIQDKKADEIIYILQINITQQYFSSSFEKIRKQIYKYITGMILSEPDRTFFIEWINNTYLKLKSFSKLSLNPYERVDATFNVGVWYRYFDLSDSDSDNLSE